MSLICIVFFSFSVVSQASGQSEGLTGAIEKILEGSDGTVGIGIKGLDSGEVFLFNKNQKYPMQSVFKFPLAMLVLDQVDKGKLSLNQKIHVKKEELLPTYSPFREKYPDGNIDVTLAELLQYTVTLSDNNTCDILFRLIGGPKNLNDYLHKLGVKEIEVVATEEAMSKHWDVQFTNWCKPAAMLELLDIFYKGKALSQTSNNFLMKIMKETATAPNRMKGLLPAGTVVAHKTGSSGTSKKGITAATNDAGIVFVPNGKHFAIVAYILNSSEKAEERDLVTAKITKAAYDYFSTK